MEKEARSPSRRRHSSIVSRLFRAREAVWHGRERGAGEESQAQAGTTGQDRRAGERRREGREAPRSAFQRGPFASHQETKDRAMKYKEWVEARMARASTPKSGAVGNRVVTGEAAMEVGDRGVQHSAEARNDNGAGVSSPLPGTDDAPAASLAPRRDSSKMVVRPEDFELVIGEVARAREDEQVALEKLRRALAERDGAVMRQV